MEMQGYSSLAEIAEIAPGGSHHPATVWRWCRKGCRGRNGKLIKLRHIRVGARVLVPTGALEEFIQDLTAADTEYFDTPAESEAPAVDEKPARRSEAQRRRDIERARGRVAPVVG